MGRNGKSREVLLFRITNSADLVFTVALATFLLVAAFTKAISGTPFDGPVPLEIVVFLEIAAALGLLFHRTQPAFRLAVAVLFFTMAMFALRAAVEGRATCACLGDVPTRPIWLASIDLFAALWLGMGSFFLRSTVHQAPRTGSASAHEPIAN